jgi:hypothetical protein
MAYALEEGEEYSGRFLWMCIKSQQYPMNKHHTHVKELLPIKH